MRRFWQEYNSRIARVAVYALCFLAALGVSDALHVTNGFAWFGIGLAATAVIYGIVVGLHLLSRLMTDRLLSHQAERQRVGRLSASLINLGVVAATVVSVALFLLDYVNLSATVAIGSLLSFIGLKVLIPFLANIPQGAGLTFGGILVKQFMDQQKKAKHK
jgi:hypothetical protein